MKFEVKIDLKDAENLSKFTTQVKNKILTDTGYDLQGNLMRSTPYDHGKASKWRINIGEDEINIFSDVQYMKYINYGSGLYGEHHQRIFPVNKKVLKFKWRNAPKKLVSKDGFVYLKSVRGIKGKHFIEKSIKDTKTKIQGFATRAINQTIG